MSRVRIDAEELWPDWVLLPIDDRFGAIYEVPDEIVHDYRYHRAQFFRARQALLEAAELES